MSLQGQLAVATTNNNNKRRTSISVDATKTLNEQNILARLEQVVKHISLSLFLSLSTF
jgi:hypothetical protein